MLVTDDVETSHDEGAWILTFDVLIVLFSNNNTDYGKLLGFETVESVRVENRDVCLDVKRSAVNITEKREQIQWSFTPGVCHKNKTVLLISQERNGRLEEEENIETNI